MMQDKLRKSFLAGLQKAGKTQNGCAKFANITPTKLSLSLSGKRAFKFEEIGPISRYLGIMLPNDILLDLNVAASLKVPVIGLIEPGVLYPHNPSDVYDEIFVPYIPAQMFENLDQYAQRLILHEERQFFSGKYYVSCVDYKQARYGFYDEGDLVVGIRTLPAGVEKGIWKIQLISQKPFATQLFVDNGDMVPLLDNPRSDRGDLEILDLILGIFVNAGKDYI